MKLVILDGYTLNPGDLSWDAFQKQFEVEYYDRTPAELVVERIGNAELILTNKVPIDEAIMKQTPNLRYIGVLATGYNIIDTQAANRQGIVVTNIPAYSTNSVAQLVFAHILAHFNRVEHHNQYIQNGGWCSSPYDSFFITPQTELAEKTLGIVGYGNIGQKIAQIAKAFDMNVLISSHSVKTNLPDGVQQVSVEALFEQSDIVSLNCPLTNETRGFVNRQLISKMKSNALIVNTGRGPLINETDLAEALQRGDIAGASLDVLSVEPPLPNNPMLHAPNCILTPHMAWATREARARLMRVALENLNAFLAGNPKNRV